MKKFVKEDYTKEEREDFFIQLKRVVKNLFKEFRLNSTLEYEQGFLFSYTVGPFNMDLWIERSKSDIFKLIEISVFTRGLSSRYETSKYQGPWNRDLVSDMSIDLNNFLSKVDILKEKVIN